MSLSEQTLMDRSLSKKERLSGVTAIEQLVKNGHFLSHGPLRCRYVKREMSADTAEATAPSIRIVVSVPKKFFKRAVKRNLLKRRIREAFRLQKSAHGQLCADIMFIYSSKEIAPYSQIYESVGELLSAIETVLSK